MDKERFERDFEHYKNGLQQNLNEREVTLMLHSYCMGYCEMINHVNEDVDGMYLVNPVLEKISELSSDFSKHFNSSKKDFSIEDMEKFVEYCRECDRRRITPFNYDRFMEELEKATKEENKG